MERNLRTALQELIDQIAKSVRPDQRAGLLDAASFQQRAGEALDHLATDPTLVQINIDEAVELIKASEADSSEAAGNT